MPTGIGQHQPAKKKRTGLLVGGAIAAVLVIGLVGGLVFFLGNGGAHVPEAGECRNLDYAAANEYVDESAPVECSADHTLYTFHVASDVKTYNDNVAAGKACYGRLETGLGVTAEQLAKTAYIVGWYWPAEATWNDGDRYLRCDIAVAVQRAPMVEMPEDPFPSEFPLALRGCIDSTIDRFVRCGTTHDYVVVDTFEMTGDAYPNTSETNLQGVSGCPTEATRYKAPSNAAWVAGNRLGLCAKYDS